MGRLLASLAVLLLGGVASAEDCVSSGSGTWSGAAGAGGTATWSGCTPTADDTYTVANGFTVTIDDDLGASGAPMTGVVRTQDGGTLSAACGVKVYANNLWVWESGSDGQWDCPPVAEAGLPQNITFPDEDTIRVDFTETGPPATICDSSTSVCDNDTIHAAHSSGEEATWLYFEWSKFGSDPDALRMLGQGGGLTLDPVYTPGIFLEVEAVNVGNDTIDLATPQSGPNEGNRHFGAGSGFVMDGSGAGDSRCNECFTDPSPGGAPGAEDADDTSGERYRNALNEAQWTVTSVALTENGTTGGWRYEIVVNTGANEPFDSDREFAGALACLADATRGEGDGDPAPTNGVRFRDVCFRILDTESDGAAGAETLVVGRDPRPVLIANDVLNVYLIKPTPGDHVQVLNPIHVYGFRSMMFRVLMGSTLGNPATSATGSPFRGVKFEAMGPNFDPSLTNANDTEQYEANNTDFPSKFGVFFGNGVTSGLRWDLIWTYHWGGQEDSTSNASNLWGGFGGPDVCGSNADQACNQAGALTISAKENPQTATDIASQTFADIRVERIWIGLPDLRTSLGSIYSGEPSISYTGFSPEVAAGPTGQNIGFRAARIPGDAVWTGFGIRKFRTDGFSGISSAIGPVFRDCPESLWLKHGLFVNAATGHERANAIGNEVFEHAGSTGTCNSSHWTIATTQPHGAPTILRCMGCLDGERTFAANTIITGSNLNSDSYGTNVYSGNNQLATSGGVDVVNWWGRQAMPNSAQFIYGTHYGHYPGNTFDPYAAPTLTTTSNDVFGWSACLDDIGTFRVGATGRNSILNSSLVDDQLIGTGPDGCAANPVLEVLDLVHLNFQGTGPVVNWNNLLSDATTCGGTIDAPGSDPCTDPLAYVYDGVLLEIEASRAYWNLLQNASEPNPSNFELRNATILTDETGSEFLIVGAGWEAANGATGKLRIGPNVHVYPAGATVCDESPATGNVFATKARCVPQDNVAYGGTGADHGVNDLTADTGASRRNGAFVPGLVPSAVIPAGANPTSYAFCDSADECDPATALPRWSGPFASWWGFGWATIDPWTYQRAEPRWGRVPLAVRQMLGGPGGGGGGGRGYRSR